MNLNDCSGKTLKPWPVLLDHYSNLLAGGENFVNGGLVALSVRLDMDLVLKGTGR
ncbi:MAG: hypothetical protein G5703_11725 [Serratia symbiotica]|nr:hypothetical protein [Serratia symbiotica]